MSADISLFKDPFKQSGESCQISSCAFVHEYYSNLFKRQTRNVPDIFVSYIKYIEECSTSAMQGSYDVTKDKDLKAKLVERNVDFPQSGFEKGATRRWRSKVSKSGYHSKFLSIF